MKLRRLELKDAPFMLEWMQDPDVTGKLRDDFQSKTMENCETFIMESWNQEENLHLGITDENDRYMGTVSLKKIRPQRSCAEFAIAVRRSAMGKGYACYGMAEILRTGWEEKHLSMIYWNVRKDNVRAVRFYDKQGYKRLSAVPECAGGGGNLVSGSLMVSGSTSRTSVKGRLIIRGFLSMCAVGIPQLTGGRCDE